MFRTFECYRSAIESPSPAGGEARTGRVMPISKASSVLHPPLSVLDLTPDSTGGPNRDAGSPKLSCADTSRPGEPHGGCGHPAWLQGHLRLRVETSNPHTRQRQFCHGDGMGAGESYHRAAVGWIQSGMATPSMSCRAGWLYFKSFAAQRSCGRPDLDTCQPLGVIRRSASNLWRTDPASTRPPVSRRELHVASSVAT